MPTRRHLIASATMLGGGLASGLITGRAFAAPRGSVAANTRFLLVFLRGAYDALNIIAPAGNAFYHAARPSIALAPPNAADPNAALALDADWSLHPALRNSMMPLWAARQIAFVPFAGTDDMSRSHFETQDTIELGQPVRINRDYGSGFMARLAGVLGAGGGGGAGGGVKPIAFTQNLPMAFRGGGPGGLVVPNIALAAAGGKPPLDPRQSALIGAMYKGQHLGGADLEKAVSTGFAARDEVFADISRETAEEMKTSGRGAVGARGFEQTARHIGHLMRGDFNLAFVDIGGWDTHVNQGGAQGTLAGRIGELGRGLAGFADEIGPENWRNTTVVVISEFGRTFHENGNKGTDHGHGSVYWVLGGGVRGGRIAGPQVRIAPETLNQNRDLPVLTDYRGLLGGLWARQYGLNAAQLARVFPAATPVDLGLV